jgi:hypothetical protein
MLAAGSDTAMNAVVIAGVLLGPVLAGAIFWFGLRHSRKHDEAATGGFTRVGVDSKDAERPD